MRNYLLLFAFLLSPFFLSAQVFIIDSPASLQGAYVFEAAAFGAPLTDSVYTAELVVMDDGEDVLTDGCTQTTNDYTDKFVLIDRGSCQFGDKCLFAENVGAAGVVVFNNQPSAGAITMGAGNLGDMVTIPCIMLSFEDGEVIKAAAAAETVTATMGNLVLPNDIATERQGIASPLTGTIDQVMWQGLSQNFTPGVRVINNGANEATNVSANCAITFDGGEVYNEASLESVNVMPGDTAFFHMPDYTITNDVTGSYSVDYSIVSDSTDDLGFDNVANTSFSVTNNVLSKGSWDFDNDTPNRTSNYRTTTAGVIEYLAGFRTPREGITLDEVTYYMSTNKASASLFESTYGVWLYKWVDADESGFAELGEIERVGLGLPSFPEGAPDQQWVTNEIIGISTPKVMTDGTEAGYFVGIKFADTDSLFTGYNENNHTWFQLEEGTIVNEADVPHHVNTDYDGELPNFETAGPFGDSGFMMAVGLRVLPPVNADEPELVGSVDIFPNPVSEVLQVEINLEQSAAEVSFTITDNLGKSLYTVTRQNMQQGNTTFNVANLPAGVYYVTIKDGKGVKTLPFSKI